MSTTTAPEASPATGGPDRIVDDFYGVFGGFYRPWIRSAHDRISGSCDGGPAIADGVVRQLAATLAHLGARSLVTEVQERRPSSFREAAEEIASDDAREAILARLPDLGRLLATVADATAASVVEAMERYTRDRGSLAAAGLPDGELRAVEVTDGDAHAGGRRVLILDTDRGRLVYKPRPLDIDLLTIELAAAVAPHLVRRRIRLPRTLARDGYGWQEFVQAQPASDDAEYREYYRNLGGVLAFFTAFGGHDLHFENVIAVGADPVVIDLETSVRVRDRFAAGTGVGDAIARETAYGPAGTLILPNLGDGGRFDIDLSAAGTELEQSSGVMSGGRLTGAGTLDIAMTQEPAVIRRVPHAPASGPLPLESLTAQLREGYDEVSDAIAAAHVELDRLLTTTDGELRDILRPTSTYAAFLEASTHPRYLRGDGERERLFGLLGEPNSVPATNARDVLEAELAALQRNDVPYFTVQPRSGTLKEALGRPAGLGDGRRGLPARRVLKDFRGRPRVKDLHVIEGVIAATAPSVWVRRPADPERQLFRVDGGSPGEAARGLADRVAELATWSDDGEACAWVTPLLSADHERLQFAAADLTLYQGGGIAVMMAAAVEAFGDERHRRPLEGFILPFLDGAQDLPGDASLSAFTGIGSAWRTLDAVGRVVDDSRIPALQRRIADAVAERIIHAASDAEVGDFIGGLPGVVPLLADASDESHPYDEAIARATALSLAAPPAEADGGLAHGRIGGLVGAAAGARIAGSDTDRLAELLADAVRDVTAAGTDRVAWCRGGSGAVVGAAEGMRRLGLSGADVAARLPGAAEYFRAARLDEDASLCHGSAGVIAAWARTADAMDDEALRQEASAAAARLAERCARDGWVGGIRHGESTLGYMLGMPGLAHTMIDASVHLRGRIAPLGTRIGERAA